MKFTEKGKKKVDILKENRKELLDVGKDTADETNLPDADDILRDVEWFADENGDYLNSWGCTDNTDLAIFLMAGEDFICEEEI